MTGHPCDGHPCDHCYVCDVVGVCCATISAELRTQLEAARPDPLHEAIKLDAGAVPGLRALVCCEAEDRSRPERARPALVAAPSGDLPINDAMKEAIHVHAPRSAR